MRHRTTAISMATLVLTSCTVGPNYRRPSVQVPQAFHAPQPLPDAEAAWLQADHESLTAKVLRKPERREVAAPVQEQLIVELYSK